MKSLTLILSLSLLLSSQFALAVSGIFDDNDSDSGLFGSVEKVALFAVAPAAAIAVEGLDQVTKDEKDSDSGLFGSVEKVALFVAAPGVAIAVEALDQVTKDEKDSSLESSRPPKHQKKIEQDTDIVNKNKKLVDEGKYLFLIDAVQDNDIEGIQIFIDHGVDINARDKKGWTPLHYTASFGYREAAYLLIKNEADVNVKDNDGNTPLHIAAIRNHVSMLKLLFSKGADINAINKAGFTPLDKAIHSDNSEFSKLLKGIGALTAKELEEAKTPKTNQSSCKNTFTK